MKEFTFVIEDPDSEDGVRFYRDIDTKENIFFDSEVEAMAYYINFMKDCSYRIYKLYNTETKTILH